MRPDRFGPPRIPRAAVARARLLALVAQRFDARVVTVEGAAGFGKTTLLAQAVADNAADPVGVDAWVTCVPADADAEHLARALAQALGDAHRGASTTADDIADLVWKRAPTPVALVLDDVHLIPPDAPGAQVLVTLLAELPTNGHLVVAGRAPLPLPTTRLLAQQQAISLTEDDLRFSPDELTAVAREHGLTDRALDASGGWPALAALGAAARPDAARRFVLEEVYSELPTDTRETLAALCLLNGGDAALLTAALERTVDIAVEIAAVPLVARHPGGWYRPHALWHPITADALDPARVRSVRRSAARGLHARGDLAGAADLVLAPSLDDDDWPVVHDLVTDGCQIGMWVHLGGVLSGWYTRLPEDRRRSPAGLLLAAVAARTREGDAAAVEHFPIALEAARTTGDVGVELAALSHLGHLAWWQDDLTTGAAVCARAAELAREGVAAAAPIAHFGEAMLAEILGDPAAELRAAEAIDRAALSDLLAAAADWLQARALIQLGRAAEAIPFARAACDRAEFPAARTALVIAHFQSGRVDDAFALAASLDPTVPASVRDRVLFAVVLASGYARLGHLPDARRVEAMAVDGAAAVAGTRAALLVDLARAAVAAADGDEAGAAARIGDAIPEPGDPGVLLPLTAFLGLLFVLLPGTRTAWDTMPLGPDHQRVREAARALVAVRAGTRAGEIPAPEMVVAGLGLRWAVELAASTGDVSLAECCIRLNPRATRARLQALVEHAPTADGARALLRQVPSPPSAGLVLRLLGPAVLERDGQPWYPPDWRRERVRSLLALLVVRGRTTRGEIGATLWPDLDAEAALGNLRVTLRYVQRVLEPERDPGAAPWYVRSAGDVLELVPHTLVVDAREMERRLDDAAEAERTGRTADVVPALRDALRWWRGDFALDLFDDWVGHERLRIRARFLAGAVRAGELLLGQGDIDEALDLGTRALAAEEWSEPAYRLVASAHLARGDRASARRALERCRAVLDDLGVDPEPATAMLWRRVVHA